MPNLDDSDQSSLQDMEGCVVLRAGKSNKAKWMLRVFESLIIALIGFLLFPVVTEWFCAPTIASPSLINLKSPIRIGAKKCLEFPFSITNQKDKPLFIVWLKLTPIVPTVLRDKLCSLIVIEPQTLDPNYTVEFKDRFCVIDQVRFDGKDDKGLSHIWLVLYSLGPKGQKNFLIKLKDHTIVSDQKDRVEIQLKTFRKYFETPPPFAREAIDIGEGRGGFPFQVPENIKNLTPIFLCAEKRTELQKE